MEFKGTPFTWHVETDRNGTYVFAGGDTPVCTVAPHDLTDEQKANAKLIANAKKLLSALQDAVTGLEWVRDETL